MTAQATQFTAPGWQFLNSGSGYLGGTESNGSYVTLKSTDGTDYSTIIETTTATAAQTVDRERLRRPVRPAPCTCGPPTSPPATRRRYFVQQPAITPVDGCYSLTVQPGYIYSLTTTTGQGKGTAASPAPGYAGAAVLRQLRQRHRRPAAAVPVADAGRLRGRAVRRRPVRALPAAAGGDRADRVGQQRQPVHHRRQPELGQLHRLGRRPDGAGGRGPAARPGRHPGAAAPRPTSTTTTCSSATPAPGRSCATPPAARSPRWPAAR